MKRRFGSFLLLSASLFLAPALFAQGTTSQATATCNFDASKQLRWNTNEWLLTPRNRCLGTRFLTTRFAPGGKPMTMFVNSPVAIGDKDIPIGAYTLFVIPSEKQWTLIISKSTDTSGKYDKHDDLARVPMQYGELPSPEDQFSVYFTHSAPGECGMRLDLENARAWVTFQEK